MLLFAIFEINKINKGSLDFIKHKVDSKTAFNFCIAPIENNSIAKNNTTDRLLNFVKYLDSAGYYCLPARPESSSNKQIKFKLLTHDNFNFYEIPFSQCKVNLHINRCFKDTSEHRQNWCKEWGLSLNTFNCVQKITQYRYYYGEKKSKIQSKKNIEHRISLHGFIEEWKFNDNNAAKAASIELGAKQKMVYMNTGGFVCYKDNYMYVFFTNASGFMFQTRHLFEKFVDDNKSTKTNL